MIAESGDDDDDDVTVDDSARSRYSTCRVLTLLVETLDSSPCVFIIDDLASEHQLFSV